MQQQERRQLWELLTDGHFRGLSLREVGLLWGKATPSSQSDYRENVYGQCGLVEEPLGLGLPAPNSSELPQFSRLVRIPSEMSLIETLKSA